MAAVLFDHRLKVLLIGNSEVGKSALALRFAQDAFPSLYRSTVGVDIKIHTLEIEGKRIKLQIWDTAGQVRVRQIAASYYEGSDAIFICFDVTKRKSFNNLQYWMDDVKAYAAENVRVFLVATK
mmetsp:Transcript_44724/g.101265  ORF Transcript_44724/g.101265 Transcript_44724/m.101265 type:complete len:124 (-) Transcript_44724:531-902(-)